MVLDPRSYLLLVREGARLAGRAWRVSNSGGRLLGQHAPEGEPYDALTAGSFTGSRTMNRVLPGSDSTSIVPPNFWVTMR